MRELVSTDKYGNDENKEWTIVVPDGEVVRLDFSTFNTEDGYDHVDVYDGCTTDDPLIQSYTGNNIPARIHSIGTKLLISFTSDDSVSRQGFSATASGAGNIFVGVPVTRANLPIPCSTVRQKLNFIY